MYKEITSPFATVNNDLPLTRREKEALSLLFVGLRYKEIAERLFISMETVKSHAANIYSKLKVNNRHEAVIRLLPILTPAELTII